MYMNRGFTVVEVLITLVIMSILLALGVVGMRGVQANARDEERRIDVDIIARGLESYYNSGNPKTFTYGTKGTYPGANEVHFMWGACTVHGGDAGYLPSVCGPDYFYQALPGLSDAATTSPDGKGISNAWLFGERNPVEIMNDTIVTRINDGHYVYKPMNASDYGACYNACPRYALIYKKETTGETVIIKSRHQ